MSNTSPMPVRRAAVWLTILVFLAALVAWANAQHSPGQIAPSAPAVVDYNQLFWRPFLEANAVDEELVRSVGVSEYGSATGAATANGKPAFGWRQDHAVTTRDLALAVVVNEARRPYAFVGVRNRSASPAAGLRPVGLEIPDSWPWPKWIGGDHQHPWGAVWLLAAAKSPEEWTCEVPGIGQRPVAWLAKARLGNLFQALAGVVRLGWHQAPHFTVNPDPSDRGYGLPLFIWGEYVRAGLSVDPEDALAFEGYLFTALKFYENAPGASFFTKAQTVTPPLPAGACYYLPGQLAQAVAGLWSVRRCVPPERAALRERIDAVLRRLCADTCERALSLGNRTPWPVTVAGGTLPTSIPSGPYSAAVGHDPGFDVTPWLAHSLAIGDRLGVAGCSAKLARVLELHAKDPAQRAWLVGAELEYLTAPAASQPATGRDR